MASTSQVNLPSEERSAAEWRSRDCPICYGGGLVVVFHRDWQGSKIGERVVRDWEYGPGGEATERDRLDRFAAEVAAHCSCPVGVWLRSRATPELLARIPSVEDILEGRTPWLFEPPLELPRTGSGRAFLEGWLAPHRKRFGVDAAKATGVGPDWGRVA